MNDNNLIPYSKRSKNEARENGKKGGINSGKARRRKRSMKAVMRELLSMPVANVEIWNALAEMGVDPENIDNQTALLAMTLKNAIMTGDYRALQAIRDIAGESNDTEKLKLQTRDLELKEERQNGNSKIEPPVIIFDNIEYAPKEQLETEKAQNGGL